MYKLESIIIRTIIYIFVPIASVIFFWWGTASLSIFRIVEFTETQIIIASCLGLALGIVLLIFSHRSLYNNFYKFKSIYLILIYLFCSAIAFAFLMGLPFLNLVLGILAGIYLGRRAQFGDLPDYKFQRHLKINSIFIAVVTALLALFIGLMSLKEDVVVNFLNSIFNVINTDVIGIYGIILAFIYSFLIFILQYYLTNKSSKIAFKLSNG